MKLPEVSNINQHNLAAAEWRKNPEAAPARTYLDSEMIWFKVSVSMPPDRFAAAGLPNPQT